MNATELLFNWTSNRNPVRLCRGHVGAYLNLNRLVWYSNVYFMPAIAFAGILCNILNTFVLCRKRNAVPSQTYLLALALCDCCFLVFGVLEVTPIHIDVLSANPEFNRVYTAAVIYVRTAASTCYKASVLLVVAFNFERYVCVCHPLQAQKFANKRVGRLVVTGALVTSLGLSLQWPIAYRRESCFNVLTNSTYYLIRLASSPSLQRYYKVMDYFAMVFFNIIPLILLAILNVQLILTLRRVVKQDMYRNGAQPPQAIGQNSVNRDTTPGRTWGANAILFAVVIMFLVCLGPQVPARVLFEVYGPRNDLVISYMAISQQLIFLNASLNFCVYCLVSRRYRNLIRKTIKELFQVHPVSFGTFKNVGTKHLPRLRRLSRKPKTLETPMDQVQSEANEENHRLLHFNSPISFVGNPIQKRSDELVPIYV